MARGNIKLLLLLFLSGCSFFSRSEPKIEHSVAEKVLEGQFFISPEQLKELAGFTYRAQFEVVVGQGEQSKVSVEDIEVVSDGKLLLFKKSIDNYHFFEFMSDGEALVVKNHHQPWRQDVEHHLYQKLLDDAVNLTQWLTDNLALDGKMSKVEKGAATEFFVNNIAVPKEATLFKLIPTETPLFALESSRVSAHINVDQGMKLPQTANFLVEALGKDQSFIKIKASVTMNNGNKDLLWPQVLNKEVSMPVNLSSRFKELLGLRK